MEKCKKESKLVVFAESSLYSNEEQEKYELHTGSHFAQ